jgi:hypothetical protein
LFRRIGSDDYSANLRSRNGLPLIRTWQGGSGLEPLVEPPVNNESSEAIADAPGLTEITEPAGDVHAFASSRSKAREALFRELGPGE